MNTNTAACNLFQTVENSNISMDSEFRNTEKHSFSILADLYSKYDDEPDFDCEFITDTKDYF